MKKLMIAMGIVLGVQNAVLANELTEEDLKNAIADGTRLCSIVGYRTDVDRLTKVFFEMYFRRPDRIKNDKKLNEEYDLIQDKAYKECLQRKLEILTPNPNIRLDAR